MTSFFIPLRESLEFSVIILLLACVFHEHKNKVFLSAILAFIVGITITWLNYPLSGLLKKIYTGFMFYSFIMLFMISLVAERKPVYPIISVFLSLLIPSAQLASVIIDNAYLKGSISYIYSLAGIMVAVFILLICFRILNRAGIKNFFGADSVFVFLASFCFIFGGLNKFESSSIVFSMQQGFHTFFSSFIPFIRDTMLIPSGKTISTQFDTIFEYLSSQRIALAITALILFFPPLYVFIKLLTTPEPVTDRIDKKAERRKVMAIYIDELLKKGTPILVALMTNIALLHSSNLAIRPTYAPEPIPVIAEGDEIIIPLKDKFGDISDGRMRKYSFSSAEKSYRLVVIMRPDGEVVAVLDACEVCPPRGYVQMSDHLVCTYCNTPIPTISLGQPGGCNPIPIKYSIKGDNLILSKNDIISAYEKEAGKETGTVLR